MDPQTLAVTWVMSNPAITTPIIGARNLEQLESSLAAIDEIHNKTSGSITMLRHSDALYLSLTLCTIL
ncbi:aldo/keto reductase [Bacillus gobiensis]|uniref:aldo/keto reductase n=1 Tax=Bacillus gobiensis TaxID=1441095 RepID=UPI003D25BCC4